MSPDYWDTARRALGRRDPVLAGIIRKHRGAALRCRGEPFVTLARAIVGQQLSVKAAATVWARFAGTIPVTPARLASAKAEVFAGAGLSRRKAEYLRDLAHQFNAGAIDPESWHDKGDETVIEELVAVRGIGRWTAEMFLIFGLLRPDVLPVDDLGLRRAVAMYYGDGSEKSVRTVSETWRPWRTVATWYLWRSLDPEPVEY